MTAVDPITFQIIRHKLHQVTEEAIIALKNVSGSPIANEGHDMMVSLYRADGSLMVGGVGFMHHLTSAAQAVQHIIKEFSEDPGIFEDDVYFLNDSYTAALHPPDVYIISPIFHEGRLTGFVANFVHVTDIGAIDPGGFSPNAREAYHEGFQTKGMKIVERGKVRRDVVQTFLNMVRDPGMTALDLKSQLAANHVAKERMAKIYRDYGVDTVDAVSAELIRESERLVRQRLAELPDGTFWAREYLDLPGPPQKVELRATKSGDTLTFDFTGTSPQSTLGINCSYWSTWGAMFAPVFPLLAWDVTWNEGVTRPFTLVAPEGTLVNCTRPAPISIATVGCIQMVNTLVTIVLSKMLGASERYRERAFGCWRGTHCAVEIHGHDARGDYYSYILTDTFGGSAGARSFKDGVDLGGDIANIVSRWANVETHEMAAPVMYLYRRAVPDSGGPGKYRGGISHEFAFTPHDTGGKAMGLVLFGKGTEAPMALGVSGGYPGCNVAFSTFRDANVADLPYSEATTRGAREETSWGTLSLPPGTIEYVRAMGSGGYGDPLDRDPDLVLHDVGLGLVSDAAARGIFGVVLDLPRRRVDAAATAERRWRLRCERAGKELPRHVVARQTVAATRMRINEYLQRTAGGETQCTWCSDVVAPAGADWKDHALRRRAPVSKAGALRTGDGKYFLVEAICGGCGTLLDTDVTRGDDVPGHDRILSWPSVTG